jgi:hypothetical protein
MEIRGLLPIQLKGAGEMMIECMCCGVSANEVKYIHFGETIVALCVPCYLTCKDLAQMKKIPFRQALEHLREALNGHEEIAEAWAEHDETLDVVRVKREPLTYDEYQELEYDFLDIYVPNPFFRNRQDQINWLNELLDIALIGNDWRWAKNLSKQIKAVKERQSHDTI